MSNFCISHKTSFIYCVNAVPHSAIKYEKLKSLYGETVNAALLSYIRKGISENSSVLSGISNVIINLNSLKASNISS